MIQGLPPFPPYNQPLLLNGQITLPWWQYLKAIDDRLRSLITAYGTGSVTVSALSSAATAGAGARAFVTDATATTFHSTVAGGGSNKVPVVSDGTNWLIG